MKGRKPIPASLISVDTHKKSKTSILSRQENERRLAVQTTNLRVPSYLTDEAKKEWRRVMKLYKQMDGTILSDLDLQALTIYCEAVSIYKKAHEVWAKHLQVVNVNEDAQKIIDKTFKTMQTQSQIIYRFSEQLCLTPVGRARMGMAKKDEPSALEKLLMDDE